MSSTVSTCKARLISWLHDALGRCYRARAGAMGVKKPARGGLAMCGATSLLL